MDLGKQRASRLTRLLIASSVLREACTPQVFHDVEKIFMYQSLFSDSSALLDGEMFVSVAEIVFFNLFILIGG